MEDRKENYEKLEGKEVLYIWGDGTEFKCKVSAIDLDIGLSIQSIEDEDNYKVCLNGPSSPVKGQYIQGEYEELFHKTVEQIKKGRVYAEDLRVLLHSKPPPFGNATVPSNICAFRQ